MYYILTNLLENAIKYLNRLIVDRIIHPDVIALLGNRGLNHLFFENRILNANNRTLVEEASLMEDTYFFEVLLKPDIISALKKHRISPSQFFLYKKNSMESTPLDLLILKKWNVAQHLCQPKMMETLGIDFFTTTNNQDESVLDCFVWHDQNEALENVFSFFFSNEAAIQKIISTNLFLIALNRIKMHVFHLLLKEANKNNVPQKIVQQVINLTCGRNILHVAGCLQDTAFFETLFQPNTIQRIGSQTILSLLEMPENKTNKTPLLFLTPNAFKVVLGYMLKKDTTELLGTQEILSCFEKIQKINPEISVALRDFLKEQDTEQHISEEIYFGLKTIAKYTTLDYIIFTLSFLILFPGSIMLFYALITLLTVLSKEHSRN